MKSKGMSGFTIIVLIVLLIVFGNVIYQVARVQVTYGTIQKKVEDAAEMGPAQSDYEIYKYLIAEAKEVSVELNPDLIMVDHSIADSFRVYVTYQDSSKIFGLITYRRHFAIDCVKPIKVRF